jgi:hypothetical protein
MSKVLMIGGAGEDRPLPEIEDGVERWGLNNLICLPCGEQRFAGCTRWFDLHHKEHITSSPKRKRTNMWSRYQKFEIPVYLWETFADLPTSCAYPREQVQAFFGGTRLFTSSLDWMLALAVFEGFTEIELYAFRMALAKYDYQVSSGRYWLKQCTDRGVTVTLLTPSALEGNDAAVDRNPPRMEPHHLMYGFETTDRSRLYSGR